MFNLFEDIFAEIVNKYIIRETCGKFRGLCFEDLLSNDLEK